MKRTWKSRICVGYLNLSLSLTLFESVLVGLAIKTQKLAQKKRVFIKIFKNKVKSARKSMSK